MKPTALPFLRNPFPKRLRQAGGLAMLLALASPAQAADGTWNANAAGNWSGTANWSGGIVADGVGATANIEFNLTGNRVITLDSARTLGILNLGDLDGTNTFTISGTNALTLDNGGAGAQINEIATAKGDTLGTALVLNDALTIANASANLLTLSGIISDTASHNVTLNGGTVLLSGANTFTGGISLNAGTLEIGNNAALGAAANTLTIDGGTLDNNSASTARTATNAVTIAGDFTYGGTGSVTLNGALTISGNRTITVGNTANSGTHTLQLGATSLGGGTLTVLGNSTQTAGTAALGLGATTLTGNEIFNVANPTASGGTGIAQLTLASLSDAGSGFGLTKNGSGILSILLGTRTGATVVNGGTLSVDMAGNVGPQGSITLNDGATLVRGDAGSGATLSGGLAISNGASVNIGGGGNGITFSGANSLGNGSTLNAINSKVIALSGSTTLGDSAEAGGVGNVNLSNTFTASTGQGTGLELTGVVSDSAGTSNSLTITSTSSGNWVELGGANSTFSGGVIVQSGGYLVVSGNSTSVSGVVTKGPLGTGTLTLNGGEIGALPTSGAGGGTGTTGATLGNAVSITSGATVAFGGNNVNGDRRMVYTGAVAIGNGATLDSPTTGGTGADVNSTLFSGAVSIGGVHGSAAIAPSATSLFIFNGAIGDGGSSDAVVIGDGTASGSVTFAGANTYSGGTTVQSGSLILSGSGTLGATAGALTVNGGTLDLGGTSQQVGNFTGTGGTVANNGSGAATLTVGTGNATGGSYAGTIADTVTGTGTVAVAKTGTGTLALSGANTYSGGTTVGAGRFLATNTSGSATGIGAVTVASHAVLGGSGSINPTGGNAVTIQSGGILAPGTSGHTDTLTLSAAGTSLSGGLLALSGAELDFNLGAGNASSLLKLTGSFAGEVTGLAGNTFAFTDLTGGSLSLGEYTLILTDEAATGSSPFAGLSLGQGVALAGFTLTGLAGDTARLELNNVGGNYALQLDVQAVPEPGAWGMLLGGAALLALFRCRAGARLLPRRP